MPEGTLRVLAATIATASLAVAQGNYEGPRTFKSSEVLPASLLKGPHYTVGAEAPTDGYFHDFKIQSDYGAMDAEGKTLLVVRLREVQALDKLAEVSKSEVFLKAAGTSVVNVGKGVANVVDDPEGTAKGVGGGLKKFGTNLGRKAKRAGDDAADAVKDDGAKASTAPQKSGGEKAAGTGEAAANSVFGVNKAMRRWAQKVGADPYTTNPVLRKALEDIGRVDAAGGIAAKVVVPIPTLVSTTASVGGLVWGKDPEELLKMNEQRLDALGVDKKVAGQFFKTKPLTLTYQTAFIDALFTVKAKGAGSYVEAATEADTEREALFFTESALMLKNFAAASPVTAVLSDSRAMVAATKDGWAVVLLPVDWVRWTQAVEKAATEIASRAKSELGVQRLGFKMSGKMSALARTRLTALGYRVEEGVQLSSVAKAAAPGTTK
jgi:hypothetical protein